MMFTPKTDADVTRAVMAKRIARWYASRYVTHPYRIPLPRPARSIQVGYRDGRIEVSVNDSVDPMHPTMQALEEFYKSADPPF